MTVQQDASDTTLDQIFEKSPSFMVLLSVPDFKFLKTNAQHLKLIRKKDILGKTVSEVEPELEAQGIIRLLQNVVKTGEPYVGNEVPIFYEAIEGLPARTRYLDFVYQPLRNMTGEIYAIAAQGHDVTEKVLSRKSIEIERENFRNLFKQTPEMVCILSGPDHRFEFVNEAHIKALGFNATGKTVREAQPESVEVYELLDGVYKTGKTAELNEIPITLGDRVRYFNLTYAARRDEAGAINGVLILGIEVTEQVDSRKVLEESQQKYRLLFDYSPLPKWIIDIETLKFVNVNQAAVHHYGYSKEEFLSMKATDIRPPEDIPVFLESLKFDFKAGEVNFDNRRRHVKKDGSIIEVEAHALDLHIGGRRQRIAAIVDVTERVRSRELMEAHNLELQKAKEDAEKANELKSAFLANMSHEIRTPLGAMMGFADLLKDPILTTTERASYLDILTRNGESLSVIINDILDLSKVEAGHLTLEYLSTRPQAIAAEVISLLGVKAKEKDLALEYFPDPSTPDSVISDPIRIRQVLLNLVSNAIKFTQFGKVVLRSYSRVEADTRVVIFEVEDTGIGITKGQEDQIFDMFVQADGSMTRRFGGTGLGLSLSKKLAHQLKGDVTVVKSVPNQGSTFRFTFSDLPHKHDLSFEQKGVASQLKMATDSGEEKQLPGIKVLVVDDSPDNQHLLWHYLTKAGAIVETAQNGIEGCKKAMAGDFDLVLMDIQMPLMDGYVATHKLREQGFRKPIIALTAHAMTEVRRKCLNVGCTDHLPKPVNRKDLLAAITRYVSTTPH